LFAFQLYYALGIFTFPNLGTLITLELKGVLRVSTQSCSCPWQLDRGHGLLFNFDDQRTPTMELDPWRAVLGPTSSRQTSSVILRVASGWAALMFPCGGPLWGASPPSDFSMRPRGQLLFFKARHTPEVGSV